MEKLRLNEVLLDFLPDKITPIHRQVIFNLFLWLTGLNWECRGKGKLVASWAARDHQGAQGHTGRKVRQVRRDASRNIKNCESL